MISQVQHYKLNWLEIIS